MPTLYWGPWLATIRRGGPVQDIMDRLFKHEKCILTIQLISTYHWNHPGWPYLTIFF
jgi:hypothetical protein